MTKLLAVLNPTEKEHFFPDGLEAQLEQIGISSEVITADVGERFPEILKEAQPEIVLGGWDMPPLPLESVTGSGGSVRYLCFLCGTVRKKIKPEHLQQGLVVSNWGNAIGPYVAECTLMLILCALRHVARYGYNLKYKGEWRTRITPNRSLFGKRVGLHGFGSIAQSLVRLMEPFNVEVTADTRVPDELLAEYGVKRAESTETLFAESDVLVELKPLTESTLNSVDEKLLRMLPEGACFVNVGRGAVVDEAAMIRVAQEGKIQFALDVFATEPLPPDSPLKELSNVMMVPHMGGATADRGRFCGNLALANIKRYLAGEPLENEVTEDIYDRAT